MVNETGVPVVSLNSLAQQAQGVQQSGSVFLIWLFGGLIVFGFIWWIFHYFFSFKNSITLYRMTSSNSKMIVTQDRFKYRQARGKLDIQLRDTGSIFGIGGLSSSIPPPDAINTTSKGKEYLVAIKVSEDELIFPGLNFDPKKIIEPKRSDFIQYEKEVKDAGGNVLKENKEYEKFYNEWKTYIDKLNFQPLTSTDRGYIINEIEDRKSRQSQGIWGFIQQHASGIMFIIFCVLIFVFWSDITKPNLEMARINAGIAQNLQEIQQTELDMLKSLNVGYTAMTGKQLPPDAYPPTRYQQQPTPPPSG